MIPDEAPTLAVLNLLARIGMVGALGHLTWDLYQMESAHPVFKAMRRVFAGATISLGWFLAAYLEHRFDFLPGPNLYHLAVQWLWVVWLPTLVPLCQLWWVLHRKESA